MKQVVFRADASASIGTGHVMRCLTLADGLRDDGFRSLFVCRRVEGHLGEYIRDRGHDVCWIDHENETAFDWEKDAQAAGDLIAKLGSKPAWLIADHYGVDAKWETALKPLAGRILVIDDLANRKHECDILLDQNACDGMETRYDDLLPANCLKLLGPSFLLLRSSFYEGRRTLRQRDGSLNRLLLFFGGSDPTGETGKALAALAQIGDLRTFQADVIIGAANPEREQIGGTISSMRHVALHIQVENMAERIAAADFALGAGGVAMWERCYLGLPSAVVVAADNQRESVKEAARRGAIWNAGGHYETSAEVYVELLKRAMASPQALLSMSRQGLRVTQSDRDRNGSPVIRAMLELEGHFERNGERKL